ncbi:MAG TPA: shikimate dehydrogenase [Chthoniobacterales bacterium]|nr:shikimate dehydrogenase [Chthoniobacterales bacterium]
MKEIYTFADLQDWRKAGGRAKPPIRLGLVGSPVAHSLSPQIQNAALKEAGIAMGYTRFEIAPEELQGALEILSALDFVGVNLTVPHKIPALAFVDEMDETARKIGAINTLKIEGGKLRAFNTDGRGFARAIREEFSVDLRDLRILVLGAGGAARAIALQCAKENCERLVIANRDVVKANALCEQLREFFAGPRVLGPVSRLQATGLDEAASRFQIANVDLLVNATPLGLRRRDALPITARLLAPHLMVYDTVYARGETALVSEARAAGARAANGLSMLLHQGALAYEIWFERSAPLDAMRNALRS